MPRVLLFLFVALLTLPAAASAQGKDDLFPRERLTKLRREIVFAEGSESVEPPQRSPSTGAPDFSDIGWPGLILIGLVLVGALGAILYFTLRTPSTVSRPPAAAPSATVRANELVEAELVERGVDPELLRRAEVAGQYDLAVRLLYITALTELNRAGAIRYRKDRSNRDYLDQLRDHPAGKDFRHLTLAYERYWYGQYAADALAYRTARSQYTDLTGRLADVSPTPNR